MGLLAVAVLLEMCAWRWSWLRAVGQVLAERLFLVMVGLPALVLIAVSAFQPRRRPRGTIEGPAGRASRWPWLLADRGLLIVAGALACVGVAALTVMWVVAVGVDSDSERAKLQVEAIKYGLGSVAAAGAAAALLLAVRRQRHAEQVHEHNVEDAAERRVTDLYTKAAEQLGHADAAVRLAGLYAMERVAQNNPSQRQTIVNVLCAYLRMPYAGPVAATHSAERPMAALPLPSREQPTDRDPQQELQVRLTAQHILTAHLSRPHDVDPKHAAALTGDSRQPFWSNIDLDLTGATIANWDLHRGHLRRANFANATFVGTAFFDQAIFTVRAGFDQVTFADDAWFYRATFPNRELFTGATFTGKAMFRDAHFTGGAWFNQAAFTADADFQQANFAGDARFYRATFAGAAGFVRVKFGGADFRQATFAGTSRFDEAMFSSAGFDQATFAGDAGFDRTTFNGSARFGGATFNRIIGLENAVVFTAAAFREDTWPPGWRLEPGSKNGRLIREEVLHQPPEPPDGTP
ncbi:hypothetical protein DMB66_58925 [Actinoplanes sp. ATCC 53533]|uniref:pentapeptide repeat-containing protein n=1 Tax=Actinoplanes sp. ATCC 53533 TaxID=1288362 RepID=UPI000F7B0DEA|nr:pentapeptide repeat-containing protein [Actinoplanes sp. ATCC 53533]RSM38550.1 hypothetical protein DMB66_58925 [Actinoplanes sp. ATCC 53533]